MTATPSIDALFEELGRVNPDLEFVVRHGDEAWEVGYPELPSILVELDAGRDRLVFSMELGVPDPARRSEVIEAAFAYALLWRETGGVRLGGTGPDEPIALIADLGTDDLTAEALAEVLGNISEKGAIWSEFITAAPATAEDAVDPIAPSGSIRV